VKRWAWFVVLGLGLCGCDSGEIVIFSPAQAGAAGLGGSAGGGAAGTSAGTAGAAPGGSGGSSDIGGGGSTIGGGGAMNPTCLSKMDCDPSSFCSKQSCADAQGVCMLLPFPDPTSSEHVCGCDDHITYWNDSLRQYFGVSASTPGVCSPDQKNRCIRPQDCPVRGASSCAHLLPPDGACDDKLSPGQCWVTPIECSKSDSPQNLICPPPGSGLQPKCATTCQAIQASVPFTQVPVGQTCQ
jgi:hypothetical protein